MGNNYYKCVLCGDIEDNSWENKVNYEFKKFLKNKGYNIYDDANDMCNLCFIMINKDKDKDK
jgi:hypothetical protein